MPPTPHTAISAMLATTGMQELVNALIVQILILWLLLALQLESLQLVQELILPNISELNASLQQPDVPQQIPLISLDAKLVQRDSICHKDLELVWPALL